MKKNKCAVRNNSSDSLYTLVKAFCIEFSKLGGTLSLLKTLLNDKERMSRVIAIARGDYFPKGYELAKLILNDDFISPEEVMAVYGFTYTENQLKYFNDTLPDDKTLLWIRAYGLTLIPGPPKKYNLLDVRELDNQLFHLKTEGWYSEDSQKFAKVDKVKAGQWLAFRKEEVPASFGKLWQEQQALITEFEYIPNVVEVCYAYIVYYKVRGVRLFSKHYARTASISADGRRVYVGGSDGSGLGINRFWDGDRNNDLGVLSALKLPLNM